VVDDGDGDGEVKGGERVREGEDVGHGDGVRLVLGGDGGEVGGPVWREGEYLGVLGSLCLTFPCHLEVKGGLSYSRSYCPVFRGG
jgi:hypothetical protein